MSGYLAAMNINKVGIDAFFDSRIKRILIPIITTALTFNSLQTYLLVESGWTEFTFNTYILNGEWISHLWFLIDLSFFFVFTYISIKFLNPIVKFFKNIFNNYLKKVHLFIIFFLFSTIILLLSSIFSFIGPYISNPIVNISSIFFYFPFFLFGMLIFKNKNLFNQFINVPIFTTIIITILFIYLSHYFKGDAHKLQKIAYYFFDIFSNFFASALCFTLFYKFFNKKSSLFSFLAEASYSIYLFHHLLVVLGALILINLKINIYLGFLILLFVISLSLFIHHYLISKINILSFLYNGKKLNKDDNA
jgi:glucan biosynthesis protein C